MGQYHTIYNKTKREYFSLGGAKLWEKAGTPACSMALMVLLSNSNGRGGGDLYVEREYTKSGKPKALKGNAKDVDDAIQAISGRWVGDIVVIQGDYAKDSDKEYITDIEARDYTNITHIIEDALSIDCEEFIKQEREFKRKFRR